ncbi:MAG: hypothetical protein GX130_14350 [Candidatus Hydrogenedens sp.]|jgi:hypothetical protein|nr:hypothetical protein [Candidatus Hydrogenedens sp.]
MKKPSVQWRSKDILYHGCIFAIALFLLSLYIPKANERFDYVHSVIERLHEDMGKYEVIATLFEIPNVEHRQWGIPEKPDSEQSDQEKIYLTWPFTHRPPGTLVITFEQDKMVSIQKRDADQWRTWEVPDNILKKLKESTPIAALALFDFFPLLCLVGFFGMILLIVTDIVQRTISLLPYLMLLGYAMGVLTFTGYTYFMNFDSWW